MWHVLVVNTVKGFETYRCTRLYAAPTVHPHAAAVFEGAAGCQMVNVTGQGLSAFRGACAGRVLSV